MISDFGYEIEDGKEPTYSFTPHDPRGEYWTYKEGRVELVIGSFNDGAYDITKKEQNDPAYNHVTTHIISLDQITLLSSHNIPTADDVRLAVARFMIFFGSEKGGYKKLAIKYGWYNTRLWIPSTEDIDFIDSKLTQIGFKRMQDGLLIWVHHSVQQS